MEGVLFFSTEEDPEDLRGYRTSSMGELVVGDHDSKSHLSASQLALLPLFYIEHKAAHVARLFQVGKIRQSLNLLALIFNFI